MDTIRLVIADDQSLITQSFKVLLETVAKDIVVVGLAMDGRKPSPSCVGSEPDVVLMDVRMPNVDGVQATKAIHRWDPGVKIIMLTTFDDDEYVHEAVRPGAVGYLLKDISTEELVSSIKAVKEGAVLVSSAVAEKLFRKAGVSPAPPGQASEAQDAVALLERLGPREIEILKMVGHGYENKEIAERLHAAEQTIKNTLSTLYKKLGVENRREARRVALKAGILLHEDLLK